MKAIGGVRDICDNYDVFILDVWGVLYDGLSVFPAVNDCLKEIKTRSKHIVLLTNASRSESLIYKFLADSGLDISCVTFIQTSGDAATADILIFFADNPKKRLYHLYSDGGKSMFSDTAIQLTDDIMQAGAIAISSNLKEGDSDTEIMRILQKAASRKLPMFCLNGDRIALRGRTKMLCAGFFADRYTNELSGEARFYGKPHKSIYNRVFERLDALGLGPRRIMVGDSMDTDILGAKNASIDSALVKTGLSARELEKTLGALWFDKMQTKYGFLPTYLAEKFGW
ncbi:MAG: TIGR01459 family HAD-type hydrolase [Holosporales bacterium]|jgi:HAD superfamily hydrolase (TIGR01459 family)|nr:TIGR01459 family HAD-type hydrolase [Holosporales bacterium]